MTRLGLDGRADVDLEEIKARQPGLPPRAVRKWLEQNWLAVLMFLSWSAGQLLTGDRWLQARSNKEEELARQVHELRGELQSAAQIYVRQDIFAVELRAINMRLASIDLKLDRR